MNLSRRPLDMMQLREGKSLLDDIWLLTLFLMIFATGVPWFWRLLNINLGPVVWGVFLYALAYLAAAYFADLVTDIRSFQALVGLTQITGSLFIGYIWHLAGAMQNPMFLLIFLIPLMGSGLAQMGWKSYVFGVTTATIVVTVAIHDTLELRWYLLQATGVPSWMIRKASDGNPNPTQIFPSINTPPQYLALLVISFLGAIAATCVLADSLTTFFFRLHERLSEGRKQLDSTEKFVDDLLTASPGADVLIDAKSFELTHASEQFMKDFNLTPDDLRHRDLFSVVEFSYPEVVEEAILQGTRLTNVIYRSGGRMYAANIRSRTVSHNGTRCAYVRIDNISSHFFQGVALESISSGIVVISPDRRICYRNQATESIFGASSCENDALECLRQDELPGEWWDLGPKTRQERQVKFGGTAYRATCVASEIDGENGRLTVIALTPSGAAR